MSKLSRFQWSPTVVLVATLLIGSGLAQGAAQVDEPGAVVRSLRRSVDTGHADAALAKIAELQAQGQVIAGLSRVQGLALYAKGDLRGADKAFAAALSEDAKDTESAQMRGLTLFRLGRPAEAIPLLEPSRGTSATGKADPNYVLGLCYTDARRYDDARHAFAAQSSGGCVAGAERDRATDPAG